ncbi:MAG: hypothetical protein ABI884_00070 [Gemmatimonadota bacterium]
MESKSADQPHLESFAGDATFGSANRHLRASLQTAFQQASSQRADVDSDDRSALRGALRDVCADARRAGLRAEQLLVLIKEVWSTLPASIARVPSVHGDERLNYVISTCVDEYYADSPRESGAAL